MTSEERAALRKKILGTASDAGLDFFVYDRREDEDLSMKDLEQALVDGIVTREEIGAAFAEDPE